MTVFMFLPVFLAVAYDLSGFWNPVIEHTEDDSPIGLVSLCILFGCWTVYYFIPKVVENQKLRPRKLKELKKDFETESNRYRSHAECGIPTAISKFDRDLIDRAPAYLKACKLVSTQEIALSALADIAMEFSLYELHKAVSKRLDEFDKQRPRLDKFVAHR